MSKLVFALEKENNTTTDGLITTETEIIPVVSTAGFALGQKVFIMEADNTELTYLGAIQAVNTDVSIEVEFGVANKEIGAKVWNAYYYMEFSESHTYPIKNTSTIMQAIGRSAGGVIRVSKKGVTQNKFNLEFEALSKADYDNLIDWYLNKVEGAGYTFVYSDVNRDLKYVKILNDILDWTEIGVELFSGSIVLEEIAEIPDWL